MLVFMNFGVSPFIVPGVLIAAGSCGTLLVA